MTQKSRRDFIRASSLLVASGAVSGGLSIARAAHARGSDLIRIGVIGCGGCGKEAAVRALCTTSGAVKLVAMADVFGDRIQAALRQMKSRHAERIDVPRARCFVGLGAYREVLALDLDLVILATPPGFRPLHFDAAIAAGKHVFMEKPVAVDAPGVRRVLQTSALARKKNLAVAVGLQHRHERAYQETVDQLRSGVIGAPVALRVYRNGGRLRSGRRQPRQSELEYQLRNWCFFRWLSGDQIVDRHIHNLDVANWVMDAFPVAANAHGGRDRDGDKSKDCGQTFSHFFCEFTYAGGAKMFSQCRHMPDCWNNVSEHLHATLGHADISGGKLYDQAGQRIWQTKAVRGGRQQQQHDLFAALRTGHVPNEADYAAKSTLTAIMGRMAAYTGQTVSWEQALNSNHSLANVDNLASLDDQAPVRPDADGNYPVPTPGQQVLDEGRSRPFSC